MARVAVLGTGMAAFGAAYRLRHEPHEVVLYDKNTFYGGHTASFRHAEGFTFDMGPHVSFTKDERIQQLLADNVDGEFEIVQYRVNNYWRGYWLPHPAQCNLYGLPAEIVVQVIADFVSQRDAPSEVRSYQDWLIRSYGRIFAELFPAIYTEKYHTTPAANMTTDWIGPRMYRASLEEMLRGALSPATRNVHYVTDFRYPSRGGFVTYLEKWAAGTKIELDHEAIRIDPHSRTVWFGNGRQEQFDAIISSVPLPELVPMIDRVPADIRAAADRLACTGCVLVSLGVDRADLSPAHISYFYDRDIVFTRASFPHMMSVRNAPAGCGSIQAEIYFSRKYKPLSGQPGDYVELTIRDLIRCGVLQANDRILFRDAQLCEYANIIFDFDRGTALGAVHGYLDSIGIAYCGRYGEWGYLWTDESFKSGEMAAGRALAALR
jgi:protoporphyrinogen oxidase